MSGSLSESLKRFGYETEDEVIKTVLDPAHGIEFVRIIFPDILGRPMDFSIPRSEVEKTFKEGKGFDGSSVQGFVRIEESDLIIKPDPRSFRVLPCWPRLFLVCMREGSLPLTSGYRFWGLS